ncbi:heterokaryon incompatibility protein-domain-containing protein [Nemania abortiva]|nr:heterokaryon incompatibility protein-domain-containing protein [Nemania abortiva]
MGCLWSRPEPVPRTLYEYPDRLPRGHIRLLECQGSIDNWFVSLFRRRLYYRLITVDLRDNPEFIAVSYMWGSSECTETMFIGDTHVLPVTASTSECLDVLSAHGYLWIDSICINQRDNEEKSQQVGFMGAIYSHATEVVGILGNSVNRIDSSYGTVFDGPSLYLNTLEIIRIDRESSQDSLRESFFLEPYRYHEEALLLRPGEYILSRLFGHRLAARAITRQLQIYSTAIQVLCHPYWRRVWILQELALAKKVEVYHDGSFLPWETLLSMVRHLMELEEDVFNSPPRQHWIQGLVYCETPTTANFLAGYQYLVEGRTKLESIFGNKHREECLRSLQLLRQIDRLRSSPKHAMKDILIDTAYSLATDPRDKVFALLGLVSAENVSPEPDHLTITPNYGKSLKEIYTEATLTLIKAGNCSTHLLAAGIGWDPENRGMPSWVVDWARPPQIFLDRDIHFRTDRLGKYWAGCTNKPDKAEEHRFTIIDSDRIMSKFLLLDKIVFLSEEIRPGAVLWLPCYLDEICRRLRKDCPRIQTFPRINKYEVIWRVLLDVPAVGRPKEGVCHGGACVVETNAFAPGFVESNGEQHLCQDLVDRAFRAWAGLAPPTLPRYHELRESFQDALSRCQSNGSRLAVTKQGYLGTVPPRTAIGDEIMVHLGCPMPVVVRSAPFQGFDLGFPRLDRYLVGKAHFLGMMRLEWIIYESVDEVKEVFASKGQNVVLL